jgi:predicted RNase H-like HicB family nuclease
MIKVLVIIEKGEHSYGAYSPNVPGCVAVGKTRQEAEQRMREALPDHIELLRKKNLPCPKSYTVWHALLAFIRTYFFSREYYIHVDIDVPSFPSQGEYSYS